MPLIAGFQKRPIQVLIIIRLFNCSSALLFINKNTPNIDKKCQYYVMGVILGSGFCNLKYNYSRY